MFSFSINNSFCKSANPGLKRSFKTNIHNLLPTVFLGSICRSDPAAEFIGWAKVVSPSSLCALQY